MNIFVGSLSYDVTEADLNEEFKKFGEVVSVKIIKDMYTDFSKGFAFVEMRNLQEAKKAIAELNGFSLNGRAIVVNEAKQRQDNGSRNNYSGNTRNSGGFRGGRS